MLRARRNARAGRALGTPGPSHEGDGQAAAERPLEATFEVLQRSAGNHAVARLVGTPLPPAVRSEMEGLFGQSFATVRIHESGAAERRGTEAFTAGNDIEFARGEFAPENERGRRILAHELTHVVQQDGQDSPGHASPDPGRLADAGLEREAARVGERAAARETVKDLAFSRIGAGAPVAQHFEEEEHKAIGDQATGGRRVELAPGYTVSYGEMVAMAGDHFESIDQMRELAAKPGRGEGTREELEYVRMVEVNDVTAMKYMFSGGARDAAEKRYYRLAASNPSHFLAPGKGDAERSVGERAQDVKTGYRAESVFPYRVEKVSLPQNAIAAYHMNHARAIGEAVAAGQSKTGIEKALATEAFSNHFLTDSFSAGHVRTERRSAFDYWNEKVPMFRYNLAGYLGQKLAEGLSSSGGIEGIFTEEGYYKGHMPNNWAGTHKKVDNALNEKGVALSFGHVVVGAIHDYDNVAGVKATVEGNEVTLYGDKHLGAGDEKALAIAAVEASVTEVEEAYRLGASGIPLDSVPATLQTGFGPVVATDGLFAAERMLPSAVPDDQATGSLDPATGLVESGPRIPWEFPSYQELLANPKFGAALDIFGKNKAGELADVVKDEGDKVKAALEEKVTSRLRGGQAAEVVREVIEWLPVLSGEDSLTTLTEQLDYADKAIETAGGAESLPLPQRKKLVKKVIDFPTEESAEKAYKLLIANPDQTQAVIDEIGLGTVASRLGTNRYLVVLMTAQKGKHATPAVH